MNLKHTIGIFLFAICLSGNSYAVDLTIDGFMSVGAGATLHSDEVVITDEINGIEYDNKENFRLGSLYAVQILSEMDDGLSATAQILGRGRNNFDAEIEWAYLSYELTPTIMIQAGRLRTPFYKHSGALDVGYSYHWVRPPETVYNIVPLSRFEGAKLTYSSNFGDNWDGYLSGIFGSAQFDVAHKGGDLIMDTRRLHGVNGRIGNDWLSFTGTYFSAVTTLQTDEEFNAGEFTIPKDTALFEDKNIYGSVFGLEIQHKKYFLQAETTTVTSKQDFYNGSSSWYVSAGKRIGKFVPHYTYSKYRDVDDPNRGQIMKLETNSLGLRYDFHPQASLKTMLTFIEDVTSEQAKLRGAAVRGDAQFAAVSVDVVF